MAKQQRPLTQKQETFVRKVAEGMAASRAYREAGYTATAHAAEVMASKTLRNDEVAARLAELRAEQAKRHEVTIDSLAREFDENRAHALRVDQVAAAVQATAMKAKLFGFMIDRQQVQVEHTLRKPSADENAPAEMSSLCRAAVTATSNKVWPVGGNTPSHPPIGLSTWVDCRRFVIGTCGGQ